MWMVMTFLLYNTKNLPEILDFQKTIGNSVSLNETEPHCCEPHHDIFVKVTKLITSPTHPVSLTLADHRPVFFCSVPALPTLQQSK